MSPFGSGFSSGTSDYPREKGSGRARDAPGVDLRAGWNTRERSERVGSAWEGRRASALVKVPELGSRKSTNPCQQAVPVQFSAANGRELRDGWNFRVEFEDPDVFELLGGANLSFIQFAWRPCACLSGDHAAR